jgi:hypothetical protein
MPLFEQFRTPSFLPEEKKKPLGQPVAAPGGMAIPGPGGITEQPGMPLRAPIRSMALPERPAPGPEALNTAAPMTSLQKPTLQQQMIPQLPGRGPEMIASNPYDAARYDYTMRGAKRNDDGSFGGDSDRVEFKRSFKDISTSALLGLQRGGIPGAIGGALIGGLNPQLAREQNFDALYGGRIQQDQARRAQAGELEAKQKRDAMMLEQEQAQTALMRANAEKAGRPEYRLENNVLYNTRDRNDFGLIPAPTRPADPRQGFFNTPRGTISTETGQIIPGTEPIPRQPSVSEQNRLSDDDVEGQFDLQQIIQDSVAGDPEGIKRYMPGVFYDLLQNGGKNPDGSDVDPEVLAQAQQAYQRAQQALVKEKTEGARANLQKEKVKARTGQPRGAKPLGVNQQPPTSNQQRSGTPRAKLSDLTKYLQ